MVTIFSDINLDSSNILHAFAEKINKRDKLDTSWREFRVCQLSKAVWHIKLMLNCEENNEPIGKLLRGNKQERGSWLEYLMDLGVKKQANKWLHCAKSQVCIGSLSIIQYSAKRLGTSDIAGDNGSQHETDTNEKFQFLWEQWHHIFVLQFDIRRRQKTCRPFPAIFLRQNLALRRKVSQDVI